ncbi:thioredoxin fold domain-containing protein [Salmonella enterica]|uniref:Thiol:disulfide interchange protein n=2 Tax=Salmonella enterica TaxID=28901 RepID=A0A750HQE2_SALER|nr:DsbC family protein [Salmonella enterica subsp. enterica serovar Java]EBR9313559.1 DsbC family protein [Salmonella enterica subsp. enterica serovar Muenchen]EDQ3993748.1 thioredoxin fold domain-containing protein [Salmonella enterica subsp. enterica]EDS8889865.1 thioredoxin fold domain-containing protein [Salmonella enterica]EDX3512274.1 thioredoxin fold domain-containing protein [Salmonella enterica subsp. enterica serovar Adelaide]EEE5035632.1 thioredoxin fold domain-containing protein [S
MTFLYNAARQGRNIIVTAQRDDRTQTLAILQADTPGHLVARGHQLLEILPPRMGQTETITLIDSPEHDAANILTAIAGCPPRRANIVSQIWLVTPVILLVLFILSSLIYHIQSEPASTPAPAMERSLPPPPMKQSAPAPVPSAMKSGIKLATPEPDGEIPAAMAQQRERLPLTLNAVSRDVPPATPAPAETDAQPAATVPEGAESAEATTARKNLATVLKRNADRGMFTINLSSGHERTLYAFLDPRCPNCRALEPVLRRLTRDFNIVVYPVSVIGGEASASHVAPLLCEKDTQKRAEGWHHLYSADEGMVTPGHKKNTLPDEDCLKAARAAIDVNNVAFHQFGFPGTPWVLSDTGWHLPAALLQEPGQVSMFLKTTDNTGEKKDE